MSFSVGKLESLLHYKTNTKNTGVFELCNLIAKGEIV